MEGYLDAAARHCFLNGRRVDSGLRVGCFDGGDCRRPRSVVLMPKGPTQQEHERAMADEAKHYKRTTVVYCGPVLRHLAGPIQAANFRSAIAF
jgi:hypothetical protein